MERYGIKAIAFHFASLNFSIAVRTSYCFSSVENDLYVQKSFNFSNGIFIPSWLFSYRSSLLIPNACR